MANPYKLVRLLGQGGMGSVHLAEDVVTQTQVAVKIIASRLLVSGRDGARRFRREAKAASAIDSPHIVRVLHYAKTCSRAQNHE